MAFEKCGESLLVFVGTWHAQVQVAGHGVRVQGTPSTTRLWLIHLLRLHSGAMTRGVSGASNFESSNIMMFDVILLPPHPLYGVNAS